MKLILRIVNIWPLFMALLIIGTAWKLLWQHVAASTNPVLQKFAGAALVQWGAG